MQAMNLLNSDALIKILRSQAVIYSQVGLARRIGCSKSYLNDVLAGRRSIGPLVLSYMGLKRTVVYELVSDNRPQFDER
jgi:hypothetical protein